MTLGLVGEWEVPHVGVTVVGPDGVLDRHGDVERPFRIASVTKLLTAYAVLIATEEGALALDELAHAGALPLRFGVHAHALRHRFAVRQEPLQHERELAVGDAPLPEQVRPALAQLVDPSPLGERHFEPGVLASANRGLLYIDEVNLLDDHVVDVLLDSAAMGMNIVEREGISFSHPARFILVGTMNPEEGDLRPQLLDRFAFSVEIRGILDKAQRVEIMRRNIAFETDPERFREQFMPQELELSGKIEHARHLVENVSYTQRDLLVIADLTSSMEVDGHRSDLVILKGARAQAAFDGRDHITSTDIALAAELALPHRVKAGPFRKSESGMETLNSKIADLKMQTTLVETQDERTQEDEQDFNRTRPCAAVAVRDVSACHASLLQHGCDRRARVARGGWWEATQSNRLDTDSSLAVREIASPIRSAMVTTRMLWAASTLDVGWIESVMTSSRSLEPVMRATAPPDSTPWVM